MITLIKATYGNANVKDVIEKNYIKNNIINFSVSNDTFGDTMPGAIKNLEIEFFDNDKLVKENAVEGEIYVYPESEEKKKRKKELRNINRETLIKYLNLKGLGIEIGVLGGYYSEKILENSELHLIILDSWRHIDEKYYYGDSANSDTGHQIVLLNETLKRLIPLYENRFTLIRELCEKAATFFKDEIFDFIYLDANHNKDFVYSELNRWWSKLKLGGVIAGHDYVNRPDNVGFGVKDAVDQFFSEKNIEFDICDFGCCPTWFATKK